MLLRVFCALFCVAAMLIVGSNGQMKAGVASVDATLPIGVPLAGFNHGPRRVPYWPLPYPQQYTTFMMPRHKIYQNHRLAQKIGVKDPNYAKALVIDDGQGNRFCFLTMDAIGADGTLFKKAFSMAQAQGFTLSEDRVILSGSHSHSGPGAVTAELLWAVAPATDLLVPAVQELLASHLATAMVQAEQNLQPAKMDVGVAMLYNATVNRRAKISPYVTRSSIDPHLGVFRVDDLNGKPIATLWNFAIHGVCYGPSNMDLSSDIMGRVNALIEQNVGGISLFANSDAGDVDPAPGACNNAPQFVGADLIAATVQQKRNSLQPTGQITLQHYAQPVPFGHTNLNLTLARVSNCSQGGFLDICGICRWLNCDLNLHLDSSWVENDPKFSAVRLTVNGVHNLIVTVPGEPIVELGTWIRNDTLPLGFNNVHVFGYSNNHMGYFTTPREYVVGGYESVLTFWGIDTAYKIRDSAYLVAKSVRP